MILKKILCHYSCLIKFLKLVLIGVCLCLSACATIQKESDYLKGTVLFKEKQYAQAFFYTQKAFEKEPDNIKYAILQSWIYYYQGQIDQASELVKKLIQQKPDAIQVIQLMAWVEYAKNNHTQSIQWFNQQLEWATQLREKNQWISRTDKQYIQSIISDAYYGLGLIEIRKKQYQQARHFFEQSLATDNQFIGHGPIKIAHADTFFNEGQYKQAIKAYQSLITDSDDSEKIAIKIAWSLYYSGQYQAAEDYLHQTIQTVSDKRPFQYALIFSKHARQQLPQAKAILLELLQHDPGYADTYYIWQLIHQTKEWFSLYLAYAKAYYYQGNYVRAGQIVQTYLVHNPNDCDAQLIDMWSELYQNHPIIALSQFHQYEKNGLCDQTQALVGKGVTFLYLGFLNDAKLTLDKAFNDQAHQTRLHMAMASWHYLSGHFEKAIALYESKLNDLKMQKDQSWPYIAMNTLGWSYIYTGHYLKAKEIFKEMQNQSFHIFTHHIFGLAWAYYKLGQIDEAVSVILNQDIINNDANRFHMALAYAHYLKGECKTAIDIYEKNEEIIPNEELLFSWGSHSLQALGWCYLKTGQYEKALTTFNRLHLYHPAPIYFENYNNLGWTYYYLGWIESAEKAFNHSLKLAPHNNLAVQGLKHINKKSK